MQSPNGHELRQLAGNAADIWQRGDGWVKLADVMESTSTELTAIGDSSVHKSKGTEKLAEMATESAGDLKDASVRYRDTGTTLRTYADALETAQTWIGRNQQSVEDAERSYQTAIDAKADAVRAQESLEHQWPWEDAPSSSELSAAASAVTTAGTTLTTGASS